MKYITYLLILLTCFSCKSKTETTEVLTIDVIEDIVIPKHYIVTKVNEQLIIDGEANETSWQSAKFTDSFIDIEGIKTPKFETKTKMLWDDEYLYVFAKLYEPHIWGNLKQRDTIIYYNNDFEVFLDPSGEAKSYGEIEINALNTVWDLFLDRPYRTGGKAHFEWNLNDLKSAVKVYGTLNNPADIDSLWTIEIAIPLKPFIRLKSKQKSTPKEGEQWRINFSRVEWDFDLKNGNYYRKKEEGKYLNEYNWVWSNQKVINMHEPEKWGFLQFTEASNSNDVAFIDDEDLLIKQAAFALFRQTRKNKLKKLLEKETGYKQVVKTVYTSEKSIDAIFFKTNFGFEYRLKSAVSDKTYLINEQGILKEL